MPLAGILTPVIVTGGGLGDGSSFRLKKDNIGAVIAGYFTVEISWLRLKMGLE